MKITITTVTRTVCTLCRLGCHALCVGNCICECQETHAALPKPPEGL